MPTPAKSSATDELSEVRKRQIAAEEVALARARAQQQTQAQAQAQAQQAETLYRQQVRQALRSQLPWVLPLGLLALLGGLFWVGLRSTAPDDGWGGILTSDLLGRCQAAVSVQVGASVPLTFPTFREVVGEGGAGQISADADGKSWNGWADSAAGRVEFVCRYSPALNSVTVEVLP